MCNIQKSSKDIYFIHGKYDFLGYDPALIWKKNTAIYEETFPLSSGYMSEKHGECCTWCKEGMDVNGANKLIIFKGLYKFRIILYILLFKFLFITQIFCIFIK